jgi:hypothetical protein
MIDKTYFLLLIPAFVVGFSCGMGYAYYGEYKYEHDKSIPRRAGTVPIVLWPFFGTCYGCALGVIFLTVTAIVVASI